jgi:malate dehydrogenase (oxaloacetate-decarboxylating)(NADP+)
LLVLSNKLADSKAKMMIHISRIDSLISFCDELFGFFSGYTLLRDPHFNKGLAFTETERDAHYLRGLLPPTVISQETQVRYLIK